MDNTARATTWQWYRFAGCIPHCVSDELKDPLLADLIRRYGREARVIVSGLTRRWMMNLGDADLQRPMETFLWSGLAVWIPSEAVRSTLAQLARVELRRFEGGARYFKFKFADKCIVMTPTQTEALRAGLHDLANAAEERIAAYYAARELSLKRADDDS